MKKTIYILIIFLLSLSSCRSLKSTKYKETYKISQRKLNKELRKQRFSAKTFESRFKLNYKDANQNITGRGRIKIKKDSLIWGSINVLGIPIIKFLITPNKVQYYNKLSSEYYDGNFELLNQQFGLDLHFENLQNLLLGDLILSVDPKKYRVSVHKNYYQLDGEENMLSEVKITSFFKVLSEIMQRKGEKLSLEYTEYQKIGKQNIPKKISVKTEGKRDKIEMKIEYKNPTINKELRFPFKIPEGYMQIEL